MALFKTGLLIRSKSKKEYSLPETSDIKCISPAFALSRKKNFMYTVEDGLNAFTTNPINPIKKIDYKKEVSSICTIDESLCLLNETSLVFYSKGSFNVISSNFKNCSLIPIHDGRVGVQSKGNLTFYDRYGKAEKTLKCQCAFSAKDILLIGDLNMLKAYVKDEFVFEVAFPSYITEIVADPLFSKIYCSTSDNNIYCYSLIGNPITSLEYHNQEVKQLRLSPCGKFLYSSDGFKLCVWNTQFNVVLGYITIDEGIESFDLYIQDEYCFDPNECLL